MTGKVLCAAILAGGCASVYAADSKEGEHLFLFTQTASGGCPDCHGEEHFADVARRRADSYHALKGWVQGCNLQFDAGWFPEDEDHVSAYLNQRFYQFPDE